MTDPLSHLQSALGDRYLVERELGQGGMATVYLAQDLKHERLVAIKVLNPDLSSTLGPERFLREIKLAASLSHPHILGVYDSGEANGVLFYVMPFVEGESLRARVTREQQLPIEEAVQIAREVSDALAYAHSRGVVHRDIKPENILLSGGHAVVADFGIARAVSEAGQDRLTKTGMAIGTPAYMSPEQASGDAVDGRSDLYSLGCVLFEMLTGRPPFVGPNSMAIMAQHSMEVVPSLTILRPSIPEELEDAVLRTLEKTPADRFATAAQFSKAISSPEATTTSARAARRRSTARTGTRSAVATRGKRRNLLWVVGIVPLVAVAWLGWKWYAGRGAPQTGDSGLDPSHVAVLYFEDQTPGKQLQHVADGFTDALIHELSEVKQLRVISRNGVLPYRAAPVAPDSIGRALNVGTLVDGTIAQSGDNLRLTVALVNAANGEEITHTTLDRPREELFALQDDLVNEVSLFLKSRLGQEIQLKQSRSGTRNVEAWELLERAKELIDGVDQLLAANDGSAASAQLFAADTLLARAESRDKRWTAPVVSRGWLDYRQVRLGVDPASAPQLLEEGIAHADQALEMKPNDADALELRGSLRYLRWLMNLESDPAKAIRLRTDGETDLRAAVAANPGQASAWAMLSHLLLGKSENSQGKLAALRAYEADPFLSNANLIVYRLFQGSFDLEDPLEAARWCAEGQRRFPLEARFTECRLWLFMMKGTAPNVTEAWRLLEEYDRLLPPPDREYGRLFGEMLVAGALARGGLVDSARAVAERSRGDGAIDPRHELALIEAIVRTLLGDLDKAVDLLSQYVASNPQVRESMARDESWYFRDLRADPRYRTLFGAAR